jgi:[ribosomal protein S5]-alanine N-acetyltransferase
MHFNIDLTALSTSRLDFRQLNMNDVDALMEFFNSEEALKHFPMIKRGERQEAVAWVERMQKRYTDHGVGLWGLTDRQNGAFVGQCGMLVQEIDGSTELEIGYSLNPSAWGQGYATEAAMSCKRYIIDHRLAPSIISIIHVDNVPSQKVAERNGMERGKRVVWRDMPVYIYRAEAL